MRVKSSTVSYYSIFIFVELKCPLYKCILLVKMTTELLTASVGGLICFKLFLSKLICSAFCLCFSAFSAVSVSWPSLGGPGAWPSQALGHPEEARRQKKQKKQKNTGKRQKKIKLRQKMQKNTWFFNNH